MPTKSFLRREEYKMLSTLSINGSILDVGGSKKSGYHELIKGDHTYTVGNIDESYGVDILFDAQMRWPFENDSFQGVLLINVLEHLYEYRTAITESIRVLDSGGTIAGVVPFMFNVHGSPNDHYRYTRPTLERMLADAGYASVEVRELGTGAFSVVYHCLIGFVRWNWLASVSMPFFAGLDRLVQVLKPKNMMGPAHFPLGYYFKATKP